MGGSGGGRAGAWGLNEGRGGGRRREEMGKGSKRIKQEGVYRGKKIRL